MIAKYKLKAEPLAKPRLESVEQWTVLLSTGDSFTVAKTPCGEWWSTLETWNRHPSREAAIERAIVIWYTTRKPLWPYQRCRSKVRSFRFKVG